MLKNHCYLLISTEFLHKCYRILSSITIIIETFYKSPTTSDFRKKWNSLKTNHHLENAAIDSSKFEKFTNNETILTSFFF